MDLSSALRFLISLTDQDLALKFSGGVSMIVSLSLAISYPTLAAAPHMFVNNNAIATAYSFPHAQQMKEYLKVVVDSILSYNKMLYSAADCMNYVPNCRMNAKIAVAMAPVAAADPGAASAVAAKEEDRVSGV